MPKKPTKRRKSTGGLEDQLVVQLLPVKKCKPHPKNAREHDEDNIRSIMTSLKSFGQRSPIVLNEDFEIVKGNGTHESACRLGWKEIRCVQHTFSSKAEEVAYMLADNKTNDLSRFNFTGLTANLKELQEAEFDLETTGFQDFETRPLLGAADWTPPEAGPAPEVASSNRLVFTDAEYQTIERAVTEVRRQWKAKDPAKADSMTDSECVVQALTSFCVRMERTRNTSTEKKPVRRRTR